MVIDDDLVDYRGTLIALALIEDCAFRLGTDLESVMRGAMAVASESRRETVNEYLSRVPGLRGIGVMKIEALRGRCFTEIWAEKPNGDRKLKR